MKKKKSLKIDKRCQILLFSLIVIFTGMWYSSKKADFDMTFSEKTEESKSDDMPEEKQNPEWESNEKIEEIKQDESKELIKPTESIEETEPVQTEPTKSAEETEPVQAENQEKKININTATAEELDTLPGIGETLSKNIIKYREEVGGFQSIEDIKNIKRIGDKTFEKLKDKITISD